MTTPRAAGYVRVASAESAQTELKRQEQQIRECAERRGYRVVAVYADVGSGNNDQRPGLQEMMADAEVGCFEVLMMRDPSRLFRRLGLFEQYYDRLQCEFGVNMIFVNREGGAE